jgi:outer membrane lipoprotein carrier protein
LPAGRLAHLGATRDFHHGLLDAQRGGAPTRASTEAVPAEQSTTPDGLAALLDKRYRTVRDFEADFVQTYRGGVLRTTAREQGTVRIKKPGLMRWMYESPEKKQFVSDGHTLYSFFPTDKQVMVSRVSPEMAATTPALFLAGKADISKDFVAAFAPSPVEGTVGLKLTPRRPDGNIEYFVVATTQSDLQIRGLIARDGQGGDSTLIFTKLKENQGISDKDFAFRIPKGVDVVTNGAGN